MNSDEQRQLEDLRRMQMDLQRQVARLDEQIARFQTKLTQETAGVPEPFPPVPAGQPSPRPAAVPPPLPPLIQVDAEIIRPAPAPVTTDTLIEKGRARRIETDAGKKPTLDLAAQVTVPADAVSKEHRARLSRSQVADNRTTLEMQIGANWLPIVGVIIILTALVFLGGYAWQHASGRFGPWSKLGILCLISGGLLGGGWWCRGRETLRRYGQVLFAGGLAAVYFTTYAAHYVEKLRVVENPFVAGLLLLGWAGLIVWHAERSHSETLALFALGLGYYTAVISSIGTFTLFSNLALTLASVFFLIRNRWAKVSFASLIATYAGFAYWRWPWTNPAGDYWLTPLFLLGYWCAFTTAVFRSRHEEFARERRAAFLTVNNGAFFALVLLNASSQNNHLWKFSLGFGLVLLALNRLAAQLFTEEKIVRDAYLAQGLVFVTAGLMIRLDGAPQAYALAAESMVLLILGYAQGRRLLKAGAGLAAVLAFFSATHTLDEGGKSSVLTSVAIGVALIFNATWAAQHQSPIVRLKLNAVRGFFAAGGMLLWVLAAFKYAPNDLLAPVLAGEALLLTFSFYALRVREISFLAQGILLLAQLNWAFHFVPGNASPPWWNPLAIIMATLAIGHWWPRQRVLLMPMEIRQALELTGALAVAGVLHFWLRAHCSPPAWLMLTSGLAVGVTAYGLATRAWLLAGAAQIFLLVSAGQFFWQHFDYGAPLWYQSATPMVALLGLAFAARRFVTADNERRARWWSPVQVLGWSYGLLAVAMSLVWTHEYIPPRERFWFLSLVGAVLFLWGGRRQNNELLSASGIYLAAAHALFWLVLGREQAVYWPNLPGILALGVLQQVAKNARLNFQLELAWHRLAMIITGGGLWLLVSRWVLLKSGGFWLTLSWAAVALLVFIAGFGLRERTYRLAGLVVLAVALVRVVFDIWDLEGLYRILSLFGLGVVLLVLGLFYNRHQKWFLDDEWLAQFTTIQGERRRRRHRRD